LILVGFAAFIALGGLLVRELWNWLLPGLFGWKAITFAQALGLLALCRILFGGVAMHGSPRSRMRERMSERWGSLSPEERERLRHGPHERAGAGPAASGATSGIPGA
jgi:hypothetical protein